MNLYSIIFEDNTVFKGGTLQEPKWLEIPNKKIRSLFYSLPLGDMLCLSGYDSYYHYVEVTQDIMGEKKGEVQLEFAYLIAKKDKENKVYEINLKSGQIEIKILNENDEFIKNLNPIGWK